MNIFSSSLFSVALGVLETADGNTFLPGFTEFRGILPSFANFFCHGLQGPRTRQRRQRVSVRVAAALQEEGAADADVERRRRRPVLAQQVRFFSLQYRISRSIGLDWTLVTNFSRDRLEIALGSIFCSFSFHRVSLETTRSVFQSAPWYFAGFRGYLPSYKRNIKNKNGGYFSYVDSSIDFSIQPCVSGRGWTLFVLYWVSRTFTEFHGNKEPYLPWSLVSTFGFPFIVSGR